MQMRRHVDGTDEGENKEALLCLQQGDVAFVFLHASLVNVIATCRRMAVYVVLVGHKETY